MTKKLKDYSSEEIKRLDEIQMLLDDYNSRVERDHSEIENKPRLTPDEVVANSIYRELLIENGRMRIQSEFSICCN